MNRLDLGNDTTLEIDGSVATTRYPDGLACPATREDNRDNQDEAMDQGYHGDDAVWQSLIEHELAHTLIAREVYHSESLVLRHEAGGEKARYALRLHEEALAISFQRWMNTGKVDPVLEQYPGEMFSRIKSRIRELTTKNGA